MHKGERQVPEQIMSRVRAFGGRQSLSEHRSIDSDTLIKETRRHPKCAKPRALSSLAALVHSCRDNRVAFELKSDMKVYGFLYHVDANMYTTIFDVEVSSGTGIQCFDEACISGAMILYVVFPDGADPINSLERCVDVHGRIGRIRRRHKLTQEHKALIHR